MKMPIFEILAYKHFFVKTLVQISTSTEVNHLISKELYNKQNGFRFIQELLVALIKIDLHCGDDTPFVRGHIPSTDFRTFKKKQALSLQCTKM